VRGNCSGKGYCATIFDERRFYGLAAGHFWAMRRSPLMACAQTEEMKFQVVVNMPKNAASICAKRVGKISEGLRVQRGFIR
jgi:hypothetical protein